MPDIELNYAGWCDSCRSPLKKQLVEIIFEKYEIKKYADNDEEESHNMGHLSEIKVCWECATRIRSDATKNLGQDDPIERTRSC